MELEPLNNSITAQIPESPLVIRMFGTMEALVHGENIPAPRNRKALWLLALLALRGERETERKWLATTLWPDSADELALYNLRRYLTVLRDLLGPESWRILAPSPRSLAFDVTGGFVDVIEFERAFMRGDSESMNSAISLYRGPFLEGCLEEWAISERDAREQAFASALERSAAASAESGDHAAAARAWRQALRIEPLSETALRGLLQALQRTGDYAAAIEAYRGFRLKLREELNAEPGPETVQLFHEIRDRQKSPPARPSRSNEAPVRRLPAPATPIIGRLCEIERIREAFSSSRLVTLTGPGGVGKTRLALELAAQLTDDYLDGAWFVELAALTDPALTSRAVAETMELREQPGSDPSTTVVRHIGSRHVLVVLDNCEHLLAACANLASALLRECPNLRILATSRQPLGISGETVWAVPSLSLPDMARIRAVDAPDATALAAESDAVRLFVRRARAAQRAFRLTEKNAPVVAELCCRLDGIPLAIELAAARARGLTAEQIVERLDRLFDLLAMGDPSTLPRQQTLRASMDWSYDLLLPEERIALRRLSVFPSGFTLEAAARICARGAGPADFEAAVFQLVEKSLVIRHDETGGPRYGLLDTVRQYAREKLIEAGELEDVRSCHLSYYCELGQKLEPDLHGPVQRDTMERLDLEIENLRSALAYSLIHPETAEDGLALAASLGRYWANRGHFSEGCGFVESLLSRTGELRTVSRVRALAVAGMMRVRLGDFDSSRRFHEESLTLARDLGDARSIWSALMRLGQAAYARQDFESAKAHHEHALSVATEMDDRHGMAAVHDLYGIVLRHCGEYAAAKTHFARSLEICREIGNVRGIADAHYGLGMVAHYLGDQEAARENLEKALEMHQETGVKIGIYLALVGLAAVRHTRKDFTCAAELLGSAEALREAIDLTPPAPAEAELLRIQSAVSSSLGESGFSAAFARGKTLTPGSFLHAGEARAVA